MKVYEGRGILTPCILLLHWVKAKVQIKTPAGLLPANEPPIPLGCGARWPQYGRY